MVTKNVPGATPLRKVRVECQKLRVFCDFCNFFGSRAPLSENPAVECQKLRVFLRVFFGPVHLSGKTRVECQKLGFFCVFEGPETVLKTVLTIRFASYGRFFERGKMNENRQKTLKTGGFLAIFSCSKQPSAGIRLSSVKNWVFLRFWCARTCAHNSFCLIRPSPDPVPR